MLPKVNSVLEASPCEWVFAVNNALSAFIEVIAVFFKISAIVFEYQGTILCIVWYILRSHLSKMKFQAVGLRQVF